MARGVVKPRLHPVAPRGRRRNPRATGIGDPTASRGAPIVPSGCPRRGGAGVHTPDVTVALYWCEGVGLESSADFTLRNGQEHIRRRPPLRRVATRTGAGRTRPSGAGRWRAASCRSTSCSTATAAAPSCCSSAAAGCEAVEAAGQGARGRPAQALDRRRGRRVNAPLPSTPGARPRSPRSRRRSTTWVPADAPAGLGEAMRYGVLDGGKRLRPLLVLAACEAVDGAARGRAARGGGGRADPRLFAGPRRHALHGQRRAAPRQADRARALRRGPGDAGRRRDAGAGLRGADARRRREVPLALQARLWALLARAAGHAGMAGGQAIDLASIGQPLDEAALRDMHRRKTGALLQASVLMGAACGEPGARRPGRRCRTTARPSAWPSRWSTTSSTSPRPPRRWARPPARTWTPTSRPMSACSAWNGRAPRARELRDAGPGRAGATAAWRRPAAGAAGRQGRRPRKLRW